MDSRSSLPMLGTSLPPVLMVAMAFALLSGGGGRERQEAALPGPAAVEVARAAVLAGQPSTEPPPATPTALTFPALDEALATTQAAQTVDAYLADAGCQRAASALVTRSARPPAAAWQARGEQVPCELSAVIVTVADYEDSNSRWQADRTLATVQSAIGALGYTLERFFLPGAGGDAGRTPATGKDGRAAPSGKGGAHARQEPGVLLFKRLAAPRLATVREAMAGDGRLEMLVVLTVPEMPTSGIERLPFLAAAHLALALHALPHRDGRAHAQTLRVVGPAYSGSSLSLLRALEEMALLEGERPDRQGLQVQVVSGSATSASNCGVLNGPLAHGGRIAFTRTVHEDDTLLRAVREQLGSIRTEWATGRGVAILVESTTGWGASLDAPSRPAADAKAASRAADDDQGCGPTVQAEDLFPEALRLGFPLHIADRYAARQRSGTALPSYAQLLAPPEVLRLDDSITPTDRLPTFTPFITNAARDLTLNGVLAQLQRHRIGAVGILGTDIRDHLFLAREINRVVPDVIMFGTEPDILMLHPEYQPYVRGTLMASSYPLQGHVQTLTHGRGMHNRRVQFTSMAQQGLYNALLKAVAEPTEVDALLIDHRAPHGSRRVPDGQQHAAGTGHEGAHDADQPVASARHPRHVPQCAAGGEQGDPERPVPWVVVAGQREFVPVSVHPELLSVQDCVLMTPRVDRNDEADRDRYLFASGQERTMWMLPPLLSIVLLGLGVLARRRPLPSGRWLSPPSPLDCRTRDERFERRTTCEFAALRAEHALFSLAAAISLSLFAAWQMHVWHDVAQHDELAHRLTQWASWLFSGLAVLGALAVLALATRRVAAVARTRASQRARVGTLALRSVAASAPEVIAFAVVGVGAWFVFAMVWYLWHTHEGSPANQLFAAARSFDLTNLLSGAPMLAVFPAMVVVWSLWSLRTLYYQRISPTCAAPLVHALVSLDAKDRRLELALRSTLGTTMQPAGAFLLVPGVVLLLIWLLLEPRVASFEGQAFGRVVLIGTTLATLAVALELGQAAWLANRVVRLLQRVRIHPIAAHVEAMEKEPLDWRPTLSPAQSPYRLLLRGLRAVGHEPPPELATIAGQDKVPLLRTQAWHAALWVAGRRLAQAGSARVALTAQEHWLAALVISVMLQSLVTRVVRGFGIAVLLLLMLLAGHLVTAFSGRSLALMIDVGLIMTAAFFAIRALLMLERDYILSKLWRGTPGSLNLNSGLVWRAVIYAGLPLLTVISVRFPEIGGRLITIIEPLRHMLPTP